MENSTPSIESLAATYRLISELLLHPADRVQSEIKKSLEIVKQGPQDILAPIEKFLEDPASHSAEEYVQTIELSPPCPLYVGHYLFDEPDSCQGAGMSGRNIYMIELINVYKHFGFEMNGKELSDYLPLMLDFHESSLGLSGMDLIGLRRWFLEKQFLPGVKPLKEALLKYESSYANLLESLEVALQKDAEMMEDQPLWEPPPNDQLQVKWSLTQQS